MKSKKPIIELNLSLGSNISPRFDHLQRAVSLIKKEIGAIKNIAPIYETPAWGFVSTPFLNTCIRITSTLTTKECLLKLQEIEKKIGRQPKTKISYESRPIDIDIIYSSEGLFNLPNLVVPHPLLQNRKFVLIPLSKIIPNYKHPLLHLTTLELLNECTDDSEITLTDLKLI